MSQTEDVQLSQQISVRTDSAQSYCSVIQNADPQATFKSMDDRNELKQQITALESNVVDTFAVLFDDDHSYASLNVSSTTLDHILSTSSLHNGSTTWINIWRPNKHEDMIQLIAKKYDFTPRLLALMCSTPVQTPRPSLQSISNHRRKWFKRGHRIVSNDSKVEEGTDIDSELSASAIDDSASQSNIYALAREIWHFTTMDFGRNYICLGYNTLYGVAPLQTHTADGNHLPSCTRVWNWLILCDNNVVISIQEDVFPQAYLTPDTLQQKIITQIRQNVMTVFRSLSLVDSDPLTSDHPMSLLPIRARLGQTTEETVHRESNAPGLLFYYLFENWQNSYTLITRKESRYGVELRHLRAQMIDRPQLEHIDRLHCIGQELGVLKRHYDSYIRLIARLLEPKPLTATSLQNSRVAEEQNDASFVENRRPLLEIKESSLGVSINTATKVRFKRLQDTIDLYALSEIDEYLNQKESLISLNFNLLTFKESLDVERLTRITLLLTKASFVFLPVSLMTSYFSVQLTNVEYDITQFWVTFTIVLCLSWIAMFLFGVLSGDAQTTAAITTAWKVLRNVSSRQ